MSLARALYSNSPLLLLDDIFWAIDTKTAFSLWNRVFCTDLLRDRTVVLVTQQTWLPAEADLSITLDNGRVKSTEQTIGHVRRPRTVRWEEDDVGIHHDISNSSITHGAKDDLVEENFDEDHIEESEDVDEEVALTSISSRLSCESLDPGQTSSPSCSVLTPDQQFSSTCSTLEVQSKSS